MNYFRTINERTLLALMVLLSLLVLSAQGVTLHVHSFDHEPLHNHHSIDNLSDYSHLSKAHFSFDISHEDHHEEVTSEIEACPDCILKQLSVVLAVALLAMVAFLLLPNLCRHTFHHHHGAAEFPWRCYFVPPLRAPPH